MEAHVICNNDQLLEVYIGDLKGAEELKNKLKDKYIKMNPDCVDICYFHVHSFHACY